MIPIKPSGLLTAALLSSVCSAGALTVVRAQNGGLAPASRPIRLIRTAGSGPWSLPSTWERGLVPSTGVSVLIRAGHRVTYDRNSGDAIRAIHISGTLAFAPDRDTRLDVGLIKIQPGEVVSENGFDCEAHLATLRMGDARPALEVGAPDHPISRNHTARIRLVYFPGMNRESCPAIVCCGGRMEFHGAPLSRTWVKLGANAQVGADTITLAEPVIGWRAGDHIIVTATEREYQSNQGSRSHRAPSPAEKTAGTSMPQRPLSAAEVRKATNAILTANPEDREGQPLQSFTEECAIRAVQGATITLDHPLKFLHIGTGNYRGEVANLSRNVSVESSDPAGVRGHTMYHRGSAGSISYAEFRHLGKEGVLGRYSLHFHLAGDTMRGSSVVGASIWDSGNRWLTIHGTNYLIVRDCVGYQSVGHGFYMEDGTEAYNVLDRNLAVQAFNGKPLPRQVFPFDRNQGGGFWWANSLNTLTRNVACECDLYGFRYEATPTAHFHLHRRVRQPDGSIRGVDIRTLPFVRFAGNEAHSVTYGLNLGEDVGGVGPDASHPFVVRDMRVWNTHWACVLAAPSLIVDGMDIYDSKYGLYHPAYDHHAYRRLTVNQTSIPEAEFSGRKPAGLALPTPDEVEALGRRVRLSGKRPAGMKPKYGLTPELVQAQGEIVRYLPATDGHSYGPLASADFPHPLVPRDDLPPATVITWTGQLHPGQLTVRGVTSDNGRVMRVVVNGRAAHALTPDFATWEIIFEGVKRGTWLLRAHAEDAAGNVERQAHLLRVTIAK